MLWISAAESWLYLVTQIIRLDVLKSKYFITLPCLAYKVFVVLIRQADGMFELVKFALFYHLTT